MFGNFDILVQSVEVFSNLIYIKSLLTCSNSANCIYFRLE